MAMALQGHQRAVQDRKLPAKVQGGRMPRYSLGKKTILGPSFGPLRFYRSSPSREAMSQPIQRSLKTSNILSLWLLKPAFQLGPRRQRLSKLTCM